MSISGEIFSEQQAKAVDTLGEWSKWLIGLNFAAGTGCMVILEAGVSALIKPYLVGAIFFLCLSILMSVFIFLSLPAIIQSLPIRHPSKNLMSIYEYKIANQISMKWLLAAQIGSLILGFAFLLLWVMLKPAHG